MKITNRLLIFILLISINVCHSQPAGLLFNSSRSYSFGYRFSNPQGSPEIAHNILETLAQGNGKNIANVAYNIGMEQSLDISTYNNFMQVGVRNSFPQPTGDVYFRNFYVGDLLIPTAVNMLVNILDNRNNLIQSLQVGNLTNSNNYSTTVGTNLFPMSNVKYSLQPVNIMLYYNNQTRINFNNRIAIINDYYGSNFILDNAQNRLYAISYVSPDNIDASLAVIQQVENDLNSIEAKNYNGLLNLTMQDPINLIQRVAAIRNILIQKRVNVNQAYASLDSYYYTKGLEASTTKNNSMAIMFFNKSLSLNPVYAPSAFQIARIKFEEGEVLNADLKLREVWFNMSPDPNTQQNCLSLFKNIYITYLNDADNFKSKEKFEDALKLYERAEKLCKEINGVNCNNSVAANSKACRQGIYNNLLNTSKKLADEGNTNDAYEKYNEARKFASTYSNDILNEAKEEETLKAIKFNEYKITAFKALSNYEKGDYNEAFLKFEAAHDLETKYKFSPSIIALDAEQKNAAKVILLKLDEVNTTLEKNDLPDAKRKLGKVLEMQAFYKLEKDNEVNNKLIPCKQKMIEKVCAQATKNFDENIAKAKSSLSQSNYIITFDLYEKAIQIADNNPECNLNVTQTKEERSKILPAATYQKLINKILDMQLNGEYKQAIEKYKEATAYYVNFDLSKFNLNKKDLFDFGKDNFKNSAVDYLANYYRGNSELDKSLELYKLLIVRNYHKRNIKNGLEDLGTTYAIRDKAANINNPKEKVLEYIGNNGDLKPFKKAYLKIFDN